MLSGLFREKASLGALGFAFFVSAANDNLFVVYGAWLEKSFHLSLTELGFGTTVIGAAELSGTSLTAAFGDKIGLKTAVGAGSILSALCYGLLPFSGESLVWSLIVLFLIFLTFEFTIVSSLSLCTELLPGARATMMAGFLAAAGLGRVIGALAGGPIWIRSGIYGIGLVSMAAGLFAYLCLAWGAGKRNFG